MTLPRLQVAQIVPSTEAEGPGRRFALWFQGCPLRCPGCCNPEFIPFQGGEAMSLADVVRMLDEASFRGAKGDSRLSLRERTLAPRNAADRDRRLQRPGIRHHPPRREPLAHAEGRGLAREARARGLTVMVFTGYLLEDARGMGPAVNDLLAHTDILVDGPYVRELPDTARRWIGSTNQRIHFLTDRYRADDPCWKERNTLEIRVRDGEISVNGFPAAHAVGLWKKPKRANG